MRQKESLSIEEAESPSCLYNYDCHTCISGLLPENCLHLCSFWVRSGARKTSLKTPIVIYYYWPCKGGAIYFTFILYMSCVYFHELMHGLWHVCVCMCLSVLCLRGRCMFCVAFPASVFSHLFPISFPGYTCNIFCVKLKDANELWCLLLYFLSNGLGQTLREVGKYLKDRK